MRTAIAAIALSSLATPILAQDAGSECGVQSDIVMQVVEARQSGDSRQAAQAEVSGELTGSAEKYVSVVPQISEWIYSLPEDQLGPKVGESWAAQCENM